MHPLCFYLDYNSSYKNYLYLALYETTLEGSTQVRVSAGKGLHTKRVFKVSLKRALLQSCGQDYGN